MFRTVATLVTHHDFDLICTHLFRRRSRRHHGGGGRGPRVATRPSSRRQTRMSDALRMFIFALSSSLFRVFVFVFVFGLSPVYLSVALRYQLRLCGVASSYQMRRNGNQVAFQPNPLQLAMVAFLVWIDGRQTISKDRKAPPCSRCLRVSAYSTISIPVQRIVPFRVPACAS